MKLAAILLLVVLTPSFAKTPRSSAAKAEFMRLHPCPSTGLHRGSCPGWIIDHIDPLCNGGRDHHSNMQWQTVAEAKEKDKWERKICRNKRIGHDAE